MAFDSLLCAISDEVIRNNTIPASEYDKVDVKRGLRNADGSGVVAGLSFVASVKGTDKKGDATVPAEGELRYRAFEIRELVNTQLAGADRFLFERTVFLLLVGRLPKEDELKGLLEEFERNRTLPKDILTHVIQGLPSQDVMNQLVTGISALYGFDAQDPNTVDPLKNFQKSIALISKLPAIVAYTYLQTHQKSPQFVEPKAGMSLAESFLYMLRQGEIPTAHDIHSLDLMLVLHAEHGGGNNSTFAARVVTSTETDVYSAMAAAVASLKGPLHGGANQKVMEMMEDIKAHVSDWTNADQVAEYSRRIMRKEVGDRSGKIYGFGHAVYTLSDPRAILLKGFAGTLAKEKARDKEYQLYELMEALVPKVFAEFKGDKKVLAPNVDFFSGFVYDCLGIPVSVDTPIFAMARSAGWCAHRLEELQSGKRVIRPAYKYIPKP